LFGAVASFDIFVDNDLNQQKEQLQPCHEGLRSFSPSNAHRCTVPLNHNFTQEDFLPSPISRLANLIEAKCGCCAILAGVPAAKHLFDLPRCPHCHETKHLQPLPKHVLKGCQEMLTCLFRSFHEI
jgi:hypothetical protein